MLLSALVDIDATQTLHSYPDARRILLGAARRTPQESVPVAEALGRVLADDVAAPIDLPSWDNSALDGYALRAAEAAGGLAIAGAIAAGDDPPPLAPGQAAEIATGGVIPDGADAVLAIEFASVVDGVVWPADGAGLQPGAGVRSVGADVRRGTVLLQRGTVVAPQGASAMAAVGLGEVAVARRPRVVVLTTGDELVAPGAGLRRGQVYDSNSLLAVATLRQLGCEATAAGRVGDRFDETRARFEEALAADIVVSSGGVSVGPRDHVKPALRDLGIEELFWRVAIQPGKPVWAGRARSGTVVLGMPGNPLSATVALHLLARPLIAEMLGRAPEQPASRRLRTAVPRLASRLRALPGVSHGDEVEVLADASHQVARTARADCLVLVPAGSGTVPAGEAVEVVTLGS
jgi:molybdopterin molybdotransferase